MIRLLLSFFLSLLLVGCGGGGSSDKGENDSSSSSSYSSGSSSNTSSSSSIDGLYTREDGAIELDIDLEGSLQNPSFSPDGKKVVFTRFRNGYNRGKADIFIYDIYQKELKTLVENDSINVNLPGKIWNASSDMFVFSSSQDGHDEIFAFYFDTMQEKRLTSREDLQAYEPTISGDEQFVIFESHELYKSNGILTKFDLTTKEYTQLTNPFDDSRQPNISHNDKYFLFQKKETSTWQIWVCDIDSLDTFQITDESYDATDAVFGAEDKTIIFSGNVSNERHANIYAIDIETKRISRLTNHTGYDGAVSVDTRNRYIVFESTPSDPDKSEGSRIFIKKMQ